MQRAGPTQRERTQEMAAGFLGDLRQDMERAAALGADLPPRLRSVHIRPGHSTPEYRNLSIPLPPGVAGASPEVLSATIARFAAAKPASCMMLALDAVIEGEDGLQPVLIAEARDRWGTRLFWMQPFRVADGVVRWGEPHDGGWRDPGDAEMILDSAFAPVAAAPAPAVEAGPAAQA